LLVQRTRTNAIERCFEKILNASRVLPHHGLLSRKIRPVIDVWREQIYRLLIIIVYI
jgi:hypothetical protein